MKPSALTLLLSGFVILGAYEAQAVMTFTHIGALPGNDTLFIEQISGDGSTLVGQSSGGSSNTQAVKWTQSDGLVGLGYLNGSNHSYAYGANTDGTVIVGYSDGVGYRWTNANGMLEIPGTDYVSSISGDGTILAGSTNSDESFLWTQESGITLIDPTNPNENGVKSLSNDGSTALGNNQTGSKLFQWSETGGIVRFDSLFNEDGAWGESISGDGSVIVGFAWIDQPDGEYVAMRIKDGEAELIGTLPGGEILGYAFDTNYDGSVIVGTSGTNSVITGLLNTAFVWDETNGMRDLAELLLGDGISLTGWSSLTATSISDDGAVIAGYGVYNGKFESWRVTGYAIPEPESFVLALSGFCIAVAWAGRKLR